MPQSATKLIWRQREYVSRKIYHSLYVIGKKLLPPTPSLTHYLLPLWERVLLLEQYWRGIDFPRYRTSRVIVPYFPGALTALSCQLQELRFFCTPKSKRRAEIVILPKKWFRDYRKIIRFVWNFFFFFTLFLNLKLSSWDWSESLVFWKLHFFVIKFWKLKCEFSGR